MVRTEGCLLYTSYRALFTPPFVCAVLALTLGMAFLLADLGRSDRILLLLTQPSLSHIVVGAYALVISVVLASVLALAWGGVFRRMAPHVFVALQVLMLAGAAVVMAYTGLLLQSMRACLLYTSGGGLARPVPAASMGDFISSEYPKF